MIGPFVGEINFKVEFCGWCASVFVPLLGGWASAARESSGTCFFPAGEWLWEIGACVVGPVVDEALALSKPARSPPLASGALGFLLAPVEVGLASPSVMSPL